MSRLKSIHLLTTLALVLSPVALWGFSAQVRAQRQAPSPIALEFPPPPAGSRSGPRSTVGGGVRGDNDASCRAEDTMPLTALMPTRDNMATTVAGNPTFFIYVPENSAEGGEFAIVSEEGEEIYFNEFEVSDTSGIVKVSLPETTNLKVGETYLWQFALVCDRSDRQTDELVQGEIERKALSEELQTQLESATPLEQAEMYAQERIWNETVTILAQLRPEYPEQWEELLTSVGLGEFSDPPFAECCTVEN